MGPNTNSRLTDSATEGATPLLVFRSDEQEVWLSHGGARFQGFFKAHNFAGKAGESCRLFDGDGDCIGIALGVGDGGLWDCAAVPASLPIGCYRLDRLPAALDPATFALGWELGTYGFDAFRSKPPEEEKLLLWPDGCDHVQVRAFADATAMVRDLISMPTSHLGPAQLEKSARDLADQFGANCSVISGNELEDGFPAIETVGRAAEPSRAPRLIEIHWGLEANPRVALVGKGVCFDTGGLDIKPHVGMKLMKKDMGGAAHVLGLAHLIMATNLPVHLHVLVPAVENSVGGRAMRPGDVVKSRSGKTIEIGHTDAEGRVILADSLSYAAESKPEILIDFATLTGAARVALGTELPALFARDEIWQAELLAASRDCEDQLWALPLFEPYRRQIKGKVADLTNAPEGGFGGAITAALFLDEFVPADVNYTHIDVMAWNTASRPGRPEGGEAMGMRAVFEALRRHFNSLEI